LPVETQTYNAGGHQQYFATSFDPEINFREFTGTACSWQNGDWQSDRMFEISKEYDLPVVGERMAYLCGHDEVHSLANNMDGRRRCALLDGIRRALHQRLHGS
jgi:saccharopine dehydrogenase-like NADP-dependent oxidoreductase